MELLRAIDLNADFGESFGRWVMGQDEHLIGHVTSVNIACGFHAGDPVTMRRSVSLAAERGVRIGAHPSLPDLLGFGRRYMQASASDIVDYVTYQVGALHAFATSEGAAVTHVKPHGALYGMVLADVNLALKLADAVRALESQLRFVVLGGTQVAQSLDAAGHLVVREGYVDLDYADDGGLIITPSLPPRTPEEVEERAAGLVSGRIVTASGETRSVEIDSICIHGDRADALEIAAAVRSGIVSAGAAVGTSHLQTSHPAKGANKKCTVVS